MRGMLLVAAAGFVGGWVAAHAYDRSLGAGVDVPAQFHYRPQPHLVADELAAAKSRHPAGKRIVRCARCDQPMADSTLGLCRAHLDVVAAQRGRPTPERQLSTRSRL